MIKKIETYICDCCKKEIPSSDLVMIREVPNEGCSTVYYRKREYDFSNKEFCSIACLFADIEKEIVK